MRVLNQKLLSIVGLAASLSAMSLAGHSRQSFVGVVYSHDLLWPNTHGIATQYDPNGGFVSTSGSQEFTGLDRNGNEQTSTFEGGGTALAQYGQLKSSTWGSLTNSFFNEANAANDLPNIYATFGQVTFNDTLKFVGSFILPTFKVRYTYFVDGEVTGDRAYGALSVDVGTNHESFYMDNNQGNTIANYYTTATYELNPMLEHDLSTNFLAGFQVDTRNLPDGFDVAGSANFGSTVTLTSVEMFDQNDNPFYDFTIESDSGTQYPAAPVPEPATITAMALGAVALLRKRRKA